MRTAKTILFWLCSPLLVVLGIAFISIITACNAWYDMHEEEPKS